LLWSQMVLAWHADCHVFSAEPEVLAASTSHEHCAEAVDQSDRAVCEAHCNPTDSSPESARPAPSVPALPLDSLANISVVLRLEKGVPEGLSVCVDDAWHRPTSHPASILLI
jgi:hypothetical protein